MPVDSNKPLPTRRAQRKITEEELKDIELKRIRGELSCAECRRLKLRCDKKVPCGSCMRRGCESICPCGILSAGQGTRFILADTETLHRKIAEMSHRIRQLEDGLAILQASVSTERHPLLRDDLLKIKFGAEALKTQQSKAQDAEEQTKQSIDALGTLTLTDAGEVKYFGRSAGSETLMVAEEAEEQLGSDEEDFEEEHHIPLPVELEELSNLLPLTSKSRKDPQHYLNLLETLLPPQDRAWALCQSYLNHASHFFRPIKRTELLESLLPYIYRSSSSSSYPSPTSTSNENDDTSRPDMSRPHALALAFFVFALGALLDLNLPPYNAEAEHYYDLGRASLSLRVVFDSPQVDTVRAIGLMATYHSLGSKRYTRDSAWCIMSFAAKLAQSIGLHRDSARWHMDVKTVEKRRTVFWEVLAADVSHSLALGRPPSIHLSYVDCEFPQDEEATLSDSGETQFGFWRMKYVFARDMFMSVADATLTAQSPSYSTVLNLDRKVREMSFPSSFKPYAIREDGEAEFFSSSLSLRDFYASQHRTVTMLYLHRSFFAQAMLDHPNNPLLSPFAPSFLTAYRCASVIIRASVHQFERCAPMAMRMWFLLYHTFSAAIIVGTVVTRSPHLNVASSALNELGLAIELFERTAVQSQRARVALNVLRKLQEKALQARSASSNPQNSHIGNGATGLPSAQKDHVDDQLAIFGGQTRVIARRSRHKHSHSSAGSGSSNSPSPPADHASSPSGSTSSSADVHPALTEYLVNGLFPPLFHSPPRPHGESGGVMLPPSTVSSPVVTMLSTMASPISTSFSRLPAENGTGEMYANFVGYPAMAHTAAPEMGVSYDTPPRSNSSSSLAGWKTEMDRQQNPVYQNWNIPMNGNYPAPHQSLSGPSPPPRQPPTFGPRGAPYNQGQAAAANAAYSYAVSQTPGMTAPANMTYAASPNENNGFMDIPMGNTDAIVEMGLTTESGMDRAWLSFMQDCGILDPGKTVA